MLTDPARHVKVQLVTPATGLMLLDPDTAWQPLGQRWVVLTSMANSVFGLGNPVTYAKTNEYGIASFTAVHWAQADTLWVHERDEMASLPIDPALADSPSPSVIMISMGVEALPDIQAFRSIAFRR